MSDLVIETSGLRKVYRSGGRRIVAVDGLDLSVPAGGVHGFLGPNGSGKTTTIRMLLGLARPTKGEMRLFGLQVPGPAAPGDRPGRRPRGGAAVPAHLLRSQEPHPARPLDRPAAAPLSTPSLEQVGLRRPGPGPLPGLLARHEAAPRDRRRAAEEPRPADPRRAHQRARPGRDPRHPGPDPRPRGVRRHRAAQLAHPGRGAAGLPLGLDRGRRAGCSPRARSSDLLGESVSRTRVGVADPQGAQALPREGRVRRDPRRRHARRRGPRRAGADHQGAGRAGHLRPASSPRSGPRSSRSSSSSPAASRTGPPRATEADDSPDEEEAS